MVLSKPEEEKSTPEFYTSAKKVVIGLAALLVIIQVVGRIAAERSSSTSSADNVFLPPNLIGYLNQGLDALFFLMPIVIGIVLGIQYYRFRLHSKSEMISDVA